MAVSSASPQSASAVRRRPEPLVDIGDIAEIGTARAAYVVVGQIGGVERDRLFQPQAVGIVVGRRPGAATRGIGMSASS